MTAAFVHVVVAGPQDMTAGIAIDLKPTFTESPKVSETLNPN